ncbi:MAG: ribosomal protein S18-alanine N-acetyltransferase [candidate division FCPU426 bacterium]
MEFEFSDLEPADLDEVVELEILCFPTPWRRSLFLEELCRKDQCTWIKASPKDPSTGFKVAAYMGFWRAVDEAHITNLAVRPQFRRQGLARALLNQTLEIAKAKGCLRATLEVRPSNLAARALYESVGFSDAAIRPRYYIDNGEDALIMWKNGL